MNAHILQFKVFRVGKKQTKSSLQQGLSVFLNSCVFLVVQISKGTCP